MKSKLFFHYISYLQYPLMIVALVFAFIPYLDGLNVTKDNVHSILESLNRTLIFMGLAISFSTLQDTTKTQNKLSQRIWEDPRKGKVAILGISLLTFFLLLLGVFGFFAATENQLKEISLGVIVLAIGLIGLLKAALEMFENHRRDKHVPVNDDVLG